MLDPAGRGRYTRRAGRLLRFMLPALAAAVIVTGTAGCGEESVRVSPMATTASQPALSEEYVREIAEFQQGNSMVVREAAINEEDGRKTVAVGIDRPAWLQDASVAGVMASYSQHVFSSLFNIPEVDSVTITMYGAQQGAAGEDVAMRVKLDRGKLPEVDWSMFGPMTMSDMVTEYYIDPAIERNSYS
ncbi:MAG: hypothetical protein C4534_09640 [Gaiellales bacterium]|nr:MAG: hypothetical protein C4534_09640 [Gaiellales bacterium]